MARPGIMLYFDILEPIRVLPDADKGRLLVAMLEYGQKGIVPDFDGMLALAWGFVRPKIDRDFEEYNRSVLRRQYATSCRERKKNGESEITFDEWLKTIDKKNQHMIPHDGKKTSMITNDDQWYPTTTTTTSTTATATTSATAAAAVTGTETDPDDTAAAAEEDDQNVKVFGGTLGKGVVLLSDAQISDLLDQMGLEQFDYYMDKLSSFIISHDAKVRNHYETILKWWRQDSRLESR